MPLLTSFLHVSSAKFSCLCGYQANDSVDGNTTPLRMMLVEEEPIHCSNASLAHSLVMDAAYSLVANSSTPCRGGCNRDLPTGGQGPSSSECCKCCQVALLVPSSGELPKKNRKRRLNNDEGGLSKYLRNAGKMEFPMPCTRADDIDEKQSDDPNVLAHIQIKYVNSLDDVIRYMAYAPSLPNHMQPLDGIILLGVGELLSRQSNSSNMELTHLCEWYIYLSEFIYILYIVLIHLLGGLLCNNSVSMLSDTANALDDNRMNVLKAAVTDLEKEDKYPEGNVAVIATIDKFTFSSVPQKVIRYFHQWIDYVAAIVPLNNDTTTFVTEDTAESHSSTWELAFESIGIFNNQGKTYSFEFKVNECADKSANGHQITWKV